MRTLTPKQNAVVDAAANRMAHYPWFTGVCLDRLEKSDAMIDQMGFDKAVEKLVDNTIYWDGPQFGAKIS
jgi:hypothetical protein